MSYPSFWLTAWVAAALFLERWSEWPLARRDWRSLLWEAGAVAGGLLLGHWVAHPLPASGTILLGAGLLGYLGLFDLASAAGVAGLRRATGPGLVGRGLLCGTGVGLLGQPSLGAALVLGAGVAAGYVAARHGGRAGTTNWRVLRLLAGLLLFVISLVTFRAAT